jgi:hypothetical protein
VRLKKPSPELLIAMIALFVALGGTGYAALALPKNSVGKKQLKKNAVTSKKVKNDSLTLNDFKTTSRAALRGPQGAPGAKGDNGDKGDAGVPATKLWARISAGTPSIVRSSGATALEGPVALGVTGAYRITFNQDVTGCVSTASISGNDGGLAPAGQIGTNNSAAVPNAIVVATYNNTGVAVNTEDFNVAVFC